jgi:glyoxylase-like metal-dependent hydrolase (beta-lactamase superfamily II)
MHDGDGATARAIERVICGVDPVRIDDDLLLVPTPGHTRGHQVLFYRNKVLFTGDHLAWSPVRETLTAFRDVCWYSWAEQTRSMGKLLAYRFEWVLPGHGRIHGGTAEEMHKHLKRCVARMKEE